MTSRNRYDIPVSAEKDGVLKPNLFIVGAPKCGTTAWVEYLSSHPKIFFSEVKEPHHFCTDFNYRWYKSRDEYLKLFENSGSAKVVGEASVWYLYSTAAAQNISEFNPAAKILIFVRDQEDSLPSLHNQILFNGDETITDFELAWRLSGARDETNTGSFCRERKWLDYKACGHFSEQVERYFDHFPAEQIRVFHFGDWTADPRATYLEILDFMGLEDNDRKDFPVVHEARRRPLRWLTPLVRRPPRISIAALRAFKRISGIGRLGVADLLLRLNTRRGYVNRPSEALRQEIRAHYEADNALLQRRLTKPAAASDVDPRHRRSPR